MNKNIVQKAVGLAMTAVMAMSGCLAQTGISALAAEEVSGMEDPVTENNDAAVASEDEPYYYVTLPKAEHLAYEAENDHICIPDPDGRTEEEKKDILLMKLL